MAGKIFAVTSRELLQLLRDRAGLLVLFVMPMALVLIMSLVQESVMKATGESSFDLLWIDHDGGPLAGEAARLLEASGVINLVRHADGIPLDEERARALLNRGDYPFCLVFPAGYSDALRRRAEQQVGAAFASSSVTALAVTVPEPQLLIDPAVQGAFRVAVSNLLQRVLLGIEVRERSSVFARELPRQMQQLGGAGSFAGLATNPVVKLDLAENGPTLLHEEFASGRGAVRPNAVQQNVPAWTLFGMFFIVVPLSGMMIRERQAGTIQRLMTLPVSPLTILAGKVFAFVLVCMVQFLGMLSIGFWVLPLLGTAALQVGASWPALLLVALCASLAATGYGLLLGTLAGSYEQASMFGAVSVVIAAAMGGVMIPLYAMPRIMQTFSLVSPLGWGLDAFHGLLVRGGGLLDIWPRLLLLFVFFVVTLLTAWYFLYHGRRRPD
ncbi:ABC transporter permease [Desulfuromonas carbonis]|uniref:ABC transporter permease n=1 Tax=Desulfuromonas sp. DDH964 TaxID=1823759 RepID=UPI00078ED139|nr:ABC transporter permease [Desulfuromonas sp. DDH964]AMV72142.1 ABC transporter membrane protein [Desulfuromonas sp. DDH964]